LSVDEEGGGSGRAADVGGLDVLGDLLLVGVAHEVVVEAVDVEVQLVGVLNEVGRLEVLLAL
jgi:hypothetical protein